MAYDFLIIGSGIAGLYTALLARELGSVLILTKGSLEECNTKYAQGGIAAPLGRGDSPGLHFQDTMAAGAGLSDPDMVRLLVTEAADRIADLTKFGITFDSLEGEVALAREAAHSLPRILHVGGDATGESIERTLSRLSRARATILENRLALEIEVAGGRARGVKCLNLETGGVEKYEARFIILATGGAGRLFSITTNPEIATGNGVALAYEAGAEVMDMEFFQFHPTALHLPGARPFLISEAVRGEGGVLRNNKGHAFMQDYSPEGDMTARDIVTRSIVEEMKKTGASNVFLDVTHLPAVHITARFPSIYRFCLEHGLDITRQPIPISPAAHYMIGGVRTNSWGETNISGLFAAGETMCTGVHGANRLASNSLLEVLVFAKRIIQRSREVLQGTPPLPWPHQDETCTLPYRETSSSGLLSVSRLQKLMWQDVGIIRSRESLLRAVDSLAAWHGTLPSAADQAKAELRHMVLVGRLMAEAAWLREESRGAHFRTDFPSPSPSWQRHLVFRKNEEEEEKDD
ncbi:MAG: L-aspartate oxidase [Chloroflexota bacterium]